MIMKRFFIIGISLCLSIAARAHKPELSSTILVEQGENKWVLQIRAALTAFEYEVHHRYGESSYSTPDEFKELVIKHVEQNVSVQFDNGQHIALENGVVKLGHETSVTFDLLGTPDNIDYASITNSSFSAIPRNQSSLMLVKKGYAKDQFKLDQRNAHTVTLKVADLKFELVAAVQHETRKVCQYLIIAGATTLLLIFSYFAMKRINNFKTIRLSKIK